ncbi:MAG TPA: YajD family HNH nuclease [Steroidobacteraceae bacterium]|nr:YajD family HNH nuclease [Steroidobacteraceae bacterium]
MTTRKRVQPDLERLDRVVADARRAKEEREQSYRGRALKLYPWICGRCAREFDHTNVHELTVHHKDHDHDNNPPDGSNWELLCLYCHDNEHQRQLDRNLGRLTGGDRADAPGASHSPFAELATLMKKEKPSPE